MTKTKRLGKVRVEPDHAAQVEKCARYVVRKMIKPRLPEGVTIHDFLFSRYRDESLSYWFGLLGGMSVALGYVSSNKMVEALGLDG